MTLRIGSLFSGIGGLELGLERAGLGDVVWQVEKDEWCRGILTTHWPGAERFDDVCTVGATTRAPVDIICGGFPCQDVSGAGKGAGLAGARSGLWYEYRRIIGELQPAACVVENVNSGARRWVPHVRRDLHLLGYRTRAYALSAFDVGAPHLRRRVFVVATHPERIELRKQQGGGSWSNGARAAELADDGPQGPAADPDGLAALQARGRADAAGVGPQRFATDAHGVQVPDAERSDRQRREGAGVATGRPCESGLAADTDGVRELQPAWGERYQWRWSRHGDGWAPEPPVPGVVDGFPDRLRWEKAFGNAVNVACAEVIGRVVMEEFGKQARRAA